MKKEFKRLFTKNSLPITVGEVAGLYILSLLLCYVLEITDFVIGCIIYAIVMFATVFLFVYLENLFAKRRNERNDKNSKDGNQADTSETDEFDGYEDKLKNASLKRKIIRSTLYFAVVAALFIGMFSFRFSARAFSSVQLYEIIFWFIVPGAKSDMSFYTRYYLQALLPALLCATAIFVGRAIMLRHKKVRSVISERAGVTHKYRRFVTKVSALSITIPFFAIYTINPEFWAEGVRYTNKSNFIENNYVALDKDKVAFGDKRNLIVIYLESFESSFTSVNDGGAFVKSLMPQLTEYAKTNVNFSGTDKIGGAVMLPGSTWTSGALFSINTGIPLIPQITPQNIIDGLNKDTPQQLRVDDMYTLGDALYDNGYNNYFLCGSDASFGARRAFFTSHHYRVYDYYTAIEDEYIPPDYDEWWGFEDNKLFTYARDCILQAAKTASSNGGNFNFSFLTADTHFPDGYPDNNMPTVFDTDVKSSQYKNVIHYSDERLAEFIEWLSEQDFFADTTIILTGDHLTMDPNLPTEISKDYTRAP
ncbi:MAG: LTA synthase family protein, partial [Oscillospiraceae bacterium]|nr:LTA synthase family protein [Oscillospiraceae bacterium]